MTTETFRGKIVLGVGAASAMSPDVMIKIRQLTGFSNLLVGTLNVHIDQPYMHRANYTLGKEHRTDCQEDWHFEECQVSRNDLAVRALILRTSRNYHGDYVLELMAELRLREFFRVSEGDEIQVTIKR